ncbi:MAG: dihydroneopterin aldolase [Verrucomicrobiae bacterium]
MDHLNEIWIKSLKVRARIGVEEAERLEPQELHVDLCIQPPVPFHLMEDDVRCTIDYAAVAGRVRELAGEGERRLIETLASDIARLLVGEFHADAVIVEVRKFVLPNAGHAAVRFRLER